MHATAQGSITKDTVIWGEAHKSFSGRNTSPCHDETNKQPALHQDQAKEPYP